MDLKGKPKVIHRQLGKPIPPQAMGNGVLVCGRVHRSRSDGPGHYLRNFGLATKGRAENPRPMAARAALLLPSLVRQRTEFTKLLQFTRARTAVRPVWYRDGITLRMAEVAAVASYWNGSRHCPCCFASHPRLAVSLYA